jgi:hypothetical protein
MGLTNKWCFFQVLFHQYILVSITLNSIAAEKNETFPQNTTVLTMCYLIEKDIEGSIYDYNKAAASLDLAMDYANNYVLPPNIRLTSVYRNIGKTCSRRNNIMAHAMKLNDDGINCSVYIGPGREKTSL